MNFEIKQFSQKYEKKWDEIVINNNESTYCHQIGWKNVIEETYRLNSCYLLAENDVGAVVGILPMFIVKDIFFGKRMISLPFVPLGGICCETDDIRDALINETINMGTDHNVDYCEIRSLTDQKYFDEFKDTNTYVTSVLSLDDTPENTLKSMARNKRKNIYKSERGNLEYNYFSDNQNTFNDFYKIYSQNMKRLGTPQHSEDFFQNILKYLNADIIGVYKDNECQYSAIVILFKESMIDFTSSALIESRKFFVTDFGVWNLILKAHDMDLRYFDFGRSVRDSENWESKRRWGAKTIDLNYYYPLSQNLNVSKLNPSKYNKIAKIWSKLPSAITSQIGPILRSRII